MEVDSIPQQTQDKTAPPENADLVVGVLAALNPDAMKSLYEGLQGLSGSPRIVILHGSASNNGVPANSQPIEGNSTFTVLPWPAQGGPDASVAPVQSISAACQSLFTTTEKLELAAAAWWHPRWITRRRVGSASC